MWASLLELLFGELGRVSGDANLYLSKYTGYSIDSILGQDVI